MRAVQPGWLGYTLERVHPETSSTQAGRLRDERDRIDPRPSLPIDALFWEFLFAGTRLCCLGCLTRMERCMGYSSFHLDQRIGSRETLLLLSFGMTLKRHRVHYSFGPGPHSGM